MDSLDYKYKHASKQKRVIALQNNRQKPAKQVQKMDDRGPLGHPHIVGSLTGFEPVTTRATIWCSTY